jgi:hypothetical protein
MYQLFSTRIFEFLHPWLQPAQCHRERQTLSSCSGLAKVKTAMLKNIKAPSSATCASLGMTWGVGSFDEPPTLIHLKVEGGRGITSRSTKNVILHTRARRMTQRRHYFNPSISFD